MFWWHYSSCDTVTLIRRQARTWPVDAWETYHLPFPFPFCYRQWLRHNFEFCTRCMLTWSKSCYWNPTNYFCIYGENLSNFRIICLIQWVQNMLSYQFICQSEIEIKKEMKVSFFLEILSSETHLVNVSV